MYYNKGVGSVLKIQIQMFDRGICAVFVKKQPHGNSPAHMGALNYQ